MKKIFTLAIATLMTVALFAADRHPSVTLTTAKRYEVVIDGRSYASGMGNMMNVNLLNRKQHTVKVYELKGGLFSKQKRLVSATTFNTNGRKDIAINVNRIGQITVKQDKDVRWDDRNDRNDRDGRGRF
ncbi:MAG TPA: hypothetical protein VHL77_06705 [Ferruginibacter sp.]|jgi:hypothetical protein|nr:hypothetical protein [Ferruginibacter sp.]